MKKNIIIIIVLLAIGFFVYYGFLTETPESESLLSGGNRGSSDILGRDISNALNRLSVLSLDTSLFENPNFIVLEDYKRTIPNQEPYRINPFLPVTAQEPALEGGALINIAPRANIAPEEVVEGAADIGAFVESEDNNEESLDENVNTNESTTISGAQVSPVTNQ